MFRGEKPLGPSGSGGFSLFRPASRSERMRPTLVGALMLALVATVVPVASARG